MQSPARPNIIRQLKIDRALFLLTGIALLLSPLTPSRAYASDAAAQAVSSPSSGTSYDDLHHLGVGLAWAPMDMVQQNGSEVFSNVGFVDARYWFNDRFGLDGGVGFGFPQVSPSSSFLATLNVEPMLALITRKHSILYANIDFIPALNTGAGLPSAVTISAGLGFESEITDIPRLSWFAQWNPVSVNWNFPHDGPTGTGVIVFGSLMNIMVGFHYYL